MEQTPPPAQAGKQPARKPAHPVAVAAASGLFVLLAIWALSDDKTAPADHAATTSAPSATVAAPATAAPVERSTLGMSLDEYVQRFAAMNQGLGSPYRLHPDVKRSTNGMGMFSVVLSDNVGVIGTVDERDQLTRVMLITGGDGSEETTANILDATVATLAAAVADTDLQDNQPTITRMMGEAIKKNGKGGKKFEVSRILNGVRLVMAVSPDTNTTFTAEPASAPHPSAPVAAN